MGDNPEEHLFFFPVVLFPCFDLIVCHYPGDMRSAGLGVTFPSGVVTNGAFPPEGAGRAQSAKVHVSTAKSGRDPD